MKYFTLDGRQSTDFHLMISGLSTWDSPEYDLSTTEIPGRNGEIIDAGGQFKNFKYKYEGCAITENFHTYFPALRSFLLRHSRQYYRLEDTYHPDIYLMAAFSGSLSPDYDAWNDAGTFDLEFNCMPQRWLKSGEMAYEVKSGQTLENPTEFDAEPLIRVYGHGTLTIGDLEVVIASNDYEYIDLDSELFDAYSGSNNANKYITSTNYEFPVFKGDEKIKITYDSTITKVVVTPRWWTL